MTAIRRYSNRKLYDVNQHRYITITELAAIVRKGEDVEVKEHDSGADITSQTLAQAIFEEQKSGLAPLPASGFARILRNGLAAVVLALATCAFGLSAFGAEVIKRDQLPGNLRGGKAAKNSDGVPSCTTGRAKMASSDELVKEWAATHEKHDCAGAATVYVCRAGKNLSVRCE